MANNLAELLPHNANATYTDESYMLSLVEVTRPPTEAELTDPKAAYEYACNVLRAKRFILGEAAIATSGPYSCWYAQNVLGRRFELGEQAIISSGAYWCVEYAQDFIKGRWPEGEAAIAQNGSASLIYAKDVLKGPFPPGERAIGDEVCNAWSYTKEILKRPFPLGERAILRSEDNGPRYIEFFKQLGIDPDEYFAERISSGGLSAEEVYGQ
jgi:hypothetical protein